MKKISLSLAIIASALTVWGQEGSQLHNQPTPPPMSVVLQDELRDKPQPSQPLNMEKYPSKEPAPVFIPTIIKLNIPEQSTAWKVIKVETFANKGYEHIYNQNDLDIRTSYFLKDQLPLGTLFYINDKGVLAIDKQGMYYYGALIKGENTAMLRIMSDYQADYYKETAISTMNQSDTEMVWDCPSEVSGELCFYRIYLQK